MNTAERKIFAAHTKAGTYCGRGIDPTDALVKVANEDELNPEMVRRVSEMLNVSLTRGFLKSASDKTASFPLADSEAAIKQVFAAEPAENKTASITGIDWGANKESCQTVTIVRKDKSEDHEFFKQARPSDKGSLSELIRQAEGARQVMELKVGKIKENKLAADSKALDSYTSIIRHFRSDGRLKDFAHFENESYSEYGTKVAHFLDAIFAELPEETPRGDGEYAKVAHYFVPADINRTFDRFIEELADMQKVASDLAEAQKEQEDFEKKIAGYYRQAAGLMAEAYRSSEHLLDFNKKAFSLVHDPLQSAIGAHEQSESAAFTKGLDAEQEALYKRPKDEVDLEMDNVRRQSILADLMANDEVIAGQDPKHIESAYNTLLQLSPKSTLHREVTRSVLRNATAQQAIDPFTAKQLTDLEGQHLKNKMLVDGKMPPQGS